jgi:hypothetical protein
METDPVAVQIRAAPDEIGKLRAELIDGLAEVRRLIGQLTEQHKRPAGDPFAESIARALRQ